LFAACGSLFREIQEGNPVMTTRSGIFAAIADPMEGVKHVRD